MNHQTCLLLCQTLCQFPGIFDDFAYDIWMWCGRLQWAVGPLAHRNTLSFSNRKHFWRRWSGSIYLGEECRLSTGSYNQRNYCRHTPPAAGTTCTANHQKDKSPSQVHFPQEGLIVVIRLMCYFGIAFSFIVTPNGATSTALVSWIFWTNVCTAGGKGDKSLVFEYQGAKRIRYFRFKTKSLNTEEFWYIWQI